MSPQIEVPAQFQSLDDMIDAKLLASRRLFFSEAVDNDTARDAIRRLWYLELTAPGKPILFIINSPGGAVDPGLAIWDQVKMISSPVTTLVTGLAASMGSILSLCAGKGRRFATPYSRFMIHQPAIHGVIQGQVTDIEIQTKEMLKTHNLIVDLYVEATGKDRATIEKSLDRDTWMTAEEAKQYGLIDQIISNYEQLKWEENIA
jgi:ATP-dependent Clp protease, protease subunit